MKVVIDLNDEDLISRMAAAHDAWWACSPSATYGEDALAHIIRQSRESMRHALRVGGCSQSVADAHEPDPEEER